MKKKPVKKVLGDTVHVTSLGTHADSWVTIHSPDGEFLFASKVFRSQAEAESLAKRSAKRWGLEIKK